MIYWMFIFFPLHIIFYILLIWVRLASWSRMIFFRCVTDLIYVYRYNSRSGRFQRVRAPGKELELYYIWVANRYGNHHLAFWGGKDELQQVRRLMYAPAPTVRRNTIVLLDKTGKAVDYPLELLDNYYAWVQEVRRNMSSIKVLMDLEKILPILGIEADRIRIITPSFTTLLLKTSGTSLEILYQE